MSEDTTLREKLLNDGYIPRAMQNDSGEMVEIPEGIRLLHAERVVDLIEAEKLAVLREIVFLINRKPESSNYIDSNEEREILAALQAQQKGSV